MRHEILAICDYASEGNNKLNMIGPFNQIFTSKVPAVHKQLFFVARVETTNEHHGKKLDILIEFIDTDGKTFVTIKPDSVSIGKPDHGNIGMMTIIYQVNDLILEKYGDYYVQLTIGSFVFDKIYFSLIPTK